MPLSFSVMLSHLHLLKQSTLDPFQEIQVTTDLQIRERTYLLT